MLVRLFVPSRICKNLATMYENQCKSMKISFNQALPLRERIGKIKIGIVETNAILEDLRMQMIGGIIGAIDIWELAFIPLLFNNSDTWLNISGDNVNTHKLTQKTVTCPNRLT